MTVFDFQPRTRENCTSALLLLVVVVVVVLSSMTRALQTPSSLLGSSDPAAKIPLRNTRISAVATSSSSLFGDRVAWSGLADNCSSPMGRHRGAKSIVVKSVIADVANDLMVPMFPKTVADPKDVAAIILGGGAGTRLFPLTRRRAKPAVSKLEVLTLYNAIFSLIERSGFDVLGTLEDT
ncbi:hypothetical protein ACLOJK_022226 [Asimina triloba]